MISILNVDYKPEPIQRKSARNLKCSALNTLFFRARDSRADFLWNSVLSKFPVLNSADYEKPKADKLQNNADQRLLLQKKKNIFVRWIYMMLF